MGVRGVCVLMCLFFDLIFVIREGVSGWWEGDERVSVKVGDR